MTDRAFDDWLAALEKRHLENLRPSEVSRALRSLSSCYVERRSKLSRGGALNTAGKRAAFALFYGPLHFLVTREIVRAIDRARYVAHILDLGCGSGAAGAAWATESGRASINGVDKHPWATSEASWTYRYFVCLPPVLKIPLKPWQVDAIFAHALHKPRIRKIFWNSVVELDGVRKLLVRFIFR